MKETCLKIILIHRDEICESTIEVCTYQSTLHTCRIQFLIFLVISIITFRTCCIAIFGWRVALLLMIICIFRIAAENKLDSTAENGKELKELSLKLQTKIVFIVFTDFLCWVPVCILGFIQVSGEWIGPADLF